jgi:small GTP-binding protein
MRNYIYRMVLIGDPATGKTTLVNRWIGAGSMFVGPTIGVDCATKIVKTEDGREFRMQIWDTSGQEIYNSITKSYYRGSAGFIIVFDVSDRGSFKHVGRWIEQIDLWASEGHHKIFLIGNKTDKDRTVSYDEAHKYASERSIEYFETNSFDIDNTVCIFNYIANEMDSLNDEPDDIDVNIKIETNRGGSFCERFRNFFLS